MGLWQYSSTPQITMSMDRISGKLHVSSHATSILYDGAGSIEVISLIASANVLLFILLISIQVRFELVLWQI